MWVSVPTGGDGCMIRRGSYRMVVGVRRMETTELDLESQFFKILPGRNTSRLTCRIGFRIRLSRLALDQGPMPQLCPSPGPFNVVSRP